MPAIRLISFGYLHLQGGPPPPADRVEDVRRRLRDPAAAKGILDLDGRDPRVQQIVLNTPGAQELLANLAAYACLPGGPQAIATGCAGGKHRAVAISEILGRELRARGFDVAIDHRHVHLPRVLKQADRLVTPEIACLCGSTRYYDQFQQAYYDLTMRGEIVLSVGFYPHAKAEHGHGEGVGHDSAEKTALDELHKRKIDLADYVLVVSDETGYFGESTKGEIRYAVDRGKPVRFTQPAAAKRARELRLTTTEADGPAADVRIGAFG